MADFAFSENDLGAIQAAKDSDKSTWSANEIEDLKTRIKRHIRGELRERCCYCRKNTRGEFAMVLDIEHILPKSKFEPLMFEMKNLSVACKRCNLNIKKADTSFIVNQEDILNAPFASENYLFIHPNLDDYYDHLSIIGQRLNDDEIVLYIIKNNSPKGAYTYEYFKLYDLEVESFDRAQGITNDDFDVFQKEIAAAFKSQLQL